MGMFRRRRRDVTAINRWQRAEPADGRHLRSWAREHLGVEAYVEPATAVTGMTVVLVAHDGEWTRRRVDGPDAARRLGKDLRIPVYDVHRVGYPQRMRDHDARLRIVRRRAAGLSGG
ncbi:oxidoreductase [Rhodococcus sp. X156]|uniref:oxidoreductase n=1 Tax=Rhodococcus sp. X156 TaxID=2499145 RepID=UPI0019D10B32|nr:oxidoreductase [Rhodococcus sp. X156]